MTALILMGLFAAFFVVPALVAWSVVFYLTGYRAGGVAAALYGGNAALAVLAMWLAVKFVPLLSVLGRPSPWFFVPAAVLGTVMGTASAQRQMRPRAARTLV